MCGILGYISNKFLKIDEINQVQNLMINRGPDYQSFVKKEFSRKNLYLFHSRLSIQDLNMRSNQPFFYKKYILLFNGEIYNFKDLREKLPNKKNLKTLSDTEVIIFMYDLFKEKCFQDFEGMWSIIIYDIERKKIIISRDRFGEKPLFIYNKNNEIVIGSQISYIQKILNQNFKLNSNKVNSFLHFGYKSIFKDNKTFFKNIDYVEKGSIITIDKNFTISEKKFWKPDFKKKNKSNLEEKIFNTRKLIFSAFEKRFISDVPIAACLSGGIDSGAIVSIASKIYNKKIECFSIIDSDSRYNEKKNISTIASDCGLKSNYIALNGKINFFKILNETINYSFYPVFTITNLIQNYLIKKISSRGYKVVLSGSGADEIFGGYYDHYLMTMYHLRNNNKELQKFKKIWEKKILKNLRNPFFKKYDLFFKDKNNRNYVYDNYKNNRKFCSKKLGYLFNEKNFSSILLKNRMANELYHENVPMFMHSEDHNSMQYSVENRSPFLDSKLAQYLNSFDESEYMKNAENKYFLRQSLNGILHEDILNNKIKSGFNASITSLFDFNSKEIKDFLNSDSAIYDFVEKKEILKLSKDSKKLYNNGYSKFFFSFISLKIFCDRFF